MTLHEKAQDLHQMILQGQILPAFDKYYADDVVMQDNDKEPRVGKAESRAFEEQFVNGLTEFRGAEVKALAVDADDEGDGVVMSEWVMDYSHEGFGDVKLEQVSVQRWKNGQIVHERFFHNAY